MYTLIVTFTDGTTAYASNLSWREVVRLQYAAHKNPVVLSTRVS